MTLHLFKVRPTQFWNVSGKAQWLTFWWLASDFGITVIKAGFEFREVTISLVTGVVLAQNFNLATVVLIVVEPHHLCRCDDFWFMPWIIFITKVLSLSEGLLVISWNIIIFNERKPREVMCLTGLYLVASFVMSLG